MFKQYVFIMYDGDPDVYCFVIEKWQLFEAKRVFAACMSRLNKYVTVS